MNDLAIVIPCRNEKNTIISILKKLKKNNIFLINDASTDGIIKIVNSFKNVKILNNLTKQGYEKTILKGFSYIKKLNSSKIKYILTMDADGDHDPKYVKKIYNKIKRYKFDLVIGNRSKKNRKSEEVISDLSKNKFNFKDPFSGFKIYEKKKLFANYRFCKNKYFLADLCLIYKKKGYEISNINIVTKKNKFRKPRVNLNKIDKRILSIKKLYNNFT